MVHRIVTKSSDFLEPSNSASIALKGDIFNEMLQPSFTIVCNSTRYKSPLELCFGSWYNNVLPATRFTETFPPLWYSGNYTGQVVSPLLYRSIYRLNLNRAICGPIGTENKLRSPIYTNYFTFRKFVIQAPQTCGALPSWNV